MTIRIRSRHAAAKGDSVAGRVMRRELIYPHRSVRSVPIAAGRVLLALLTAVLVTAGVVWRPGVTLKLHDDLTRAALVLAGIPVAGAAVAEVFPALGDAPLTVVTVPRMEQQPWKHGILFACALGILILVYRKVEMARGFVAFLSVTLLLGSAMILLQPESQFGSAEFTLMWVRTEILVWMVLPWFAAALFLMAAPLGGVGIAGVFLLEAFAFGWSAMRMAFGLAAMYYSGILFAPLLWFALGLLADVTYVMVTYSLVMNFAVRRAWGKRVAWQS